MSESDESPRDLWVEARRLAQTEHLEWTYYLHLLRAVALKSQVGPEVPRGLDLFYEPISEWSELTWLFQLRNLLMDRGFPLNLTLGVSLGLEMFDSAYRAPAGRLALPAAEEPFRGRHQVQALDIEGDTEILFANSWGEEWGYNGLGVIPREYFERHVDAVWVTRPSWIGVSAATLRRIRAELWRRGTPHEAATTYDLIETWDTGNKPFSKMLSHNGRLVEATARSLVQLRGGMSPVDLIQVRVDDRERPSARAHVSHHAGATSTIEEIFVPPSARRQGLGTLLDELCLELAARHGSEHVELWLHEADRPHDTSVVEGFLAARGYESTSERQRRPNVLVAAKEIR